MAIVPQNGTLHWMITEKVNTENMALFLGQTGKAHPDWHVLMVLDGASSHRGKALEFPENISLIPLPAYLLEIIPNEFLWHELHEKMCHQVFESLNDVCNEVENGLRKIVSALPAVSRLSGWQWKINSIVLSAI